MDNARMLKFSSYVSSAIYKQNVSISLCLSDSVQCRSSVSEEGKILLLKDFMTCSESFYIQRGPSLSFGTL